MLYSGWFFTSANRMPAKETARFLCTLEVLEHRGDLGGDDGSRQVSVALDVVSDDMGTNSALYFLPVIADVALEGGPHAERAASLFETLCMRSGLEGARAGKVARHLTRRAVTARDVLGMVPPRGDASDVDSSMRGYIDLGIHLDALAFASLLHALPADELKVSMEEGPVAAFVEDALAFRHGRYVMTIVYDLLLKADLTLLNELAGDVIEGLRNYFHYPDYVCLLAKREVVEKGPDKVLRERLAKAGYPFGRVRVDNLRVWLSRSGADSRETTLVLRHLWDFAHFLAVMEADSEERQHCAEQLLRHWSSLTSAMSDPRDEGWQESDVPWMPRVGQEYDRGIAEHVAPQPTVVKLGLAAPLVLTLARCMADDEYLLDLVLNGMDCIGGKALRGIARGFEESAAYSRPVGALVAYAATCLDAIAHGYVCPSMPRLLARHVEDAVRPLLHRERVPEGQVDFLHCGASLMACAHVAYEEVSGVVPLGLDVSPWNDGAGSSLAARICSIALRDFWAYREDELRAATQGTDDGPRLPARPEQVITEPVYLSYEQYPDVLADALETGALTAEDWVRRDWVDIRPKCRLTDPASMLSWPGMLADWHDVGIDYSRYESSDDRVRSRALSVLAFKSLAILRYASENPGSPMEGDDAATLVSWARAMLRAGEAKDLRRIARAASAEALGYLLENDVASRVTACGAQDASADDIALSIMQALVELSVSSVHYQYIVGKRISDAARDGSVLARDLVVPYVGLLYSQIVSDVREGSLGAGIFQRAAERETVGDMRLRILTWFLGSVSGLLCDGGRLADRVWSVFLGWDERREGCYRAKVGISAEEVLVALIDANGVASKELASSDPWTFSRWDPDARKPSVASGLIRTVRVGDGFPVPVERGLHELVAYAWTGERRGEVRLTVAYLDAGDVVAATEEPGLLFRLPPQAWEGGSYARVVSRWEDPVSGESESPAGRSVLVRVACDEAAKSLPLLQLVESDDGAITYANLFHEGDALTVADGHALAAGFTVSVVGVAGALGSLVVADGGWDIIAQRTGAVRAASAKREFSLRCARDEEASVIRHLLGMSVGDVVMGRRDGWLNKTLGEVVFRDERGGAEMRVSSESAALELRDLERKTLRDVPLLLTNCRRTDANGVVWSYCLEEGSLVVVRYLDGGEVREARVSAREMRASQRDLRLGRPVKVSPDGTVRIDDGRRAVRARRLWRVEFAEGSARPRLSDGMTYIGKSDIPGLEGDDATPAATYYLVQDAMAGVLTAYRRPPFKESMRRCGVRLPTTVRLVHSFPDARRRDVVRVEGPHGSSFGESARGSYPARGAQCGSAGVELVAVEHGGEMLYDVHRVFGAPMAAGLAVGPQALTREQRDARERARVAGGLMREYNSWLGDVCWQDGVFHLLDGAIGSGPDGSLTLEPIDPVSSLPRDMRSPSSTEPSEWHSCISLALEDDNLRSYRYARVAVTGDELTGSPVAQQRACPLLDFEAFDAWVSSHFGRSITYGQLPLYFRDGDDSHVTFDFGLGLSFVVGREYVRVDGVQGDLSFVFYGDRVESFGISRQGDALFLELSRSAFRLGIEHRILDDSASGILQCIRIRLGGEAGKPVVTHVSVSARGSGSFRRSGWEYEPYTEGELDEDALALANTLPALGVAQIVFAKAAWKDDAKRFAFEAIAPEKIKRNDILCLFAGSIQSRGNDYFVQFALDPTDQGAAGFGADSVRVDVSRRFFSFNEETLRSLSAISPGAFSGHMLVRVRERRGPKVLGALTTLPLRDSASILGWMRQRDAAPFVVIGPTRENDLGNTITLVEMRPGVLGEAIAVDDRCKQGTIGRLIADEAAGCVLVESVSESDREFVTNERIVELLILDGVFSNRERGAQESDFTVAGLPQVLLTNHKLAKTLRYVRPPRYGLVRDGELSRAEDVRYGFVKAIGGTKKDKRKRISGIQTNASDPSAFAQISFFDAGFFELWEHIRTGSWHYHDRCTRVLRSGQPPKTFEYASGMDLPVIFQRGRSLRYAQDSLEYFAFPPHELSEYGVPAERARVLGNGFPVAGRSSRGLYLELMPGRIVRIPLAMVHIARPGNDRGRWRTDVVGVGDVVHIELTNPAPGEPVAIVITGVDYGWRTLAAHGMHLPVRDRRLGRVTFGAGVCSLAYPTFARLEPGGAYHIDAGNCVSASSEAPSSGDLVLIRQAEDGRLTVEGRADLSAELSGTDMWGREGRWICSALSDDSDATIFAAFRGSIPMVVDGVSGNVVSVHYPQPDMRPHNGDILCCTVVGTGGEKHPDTMFVRSGAYLIRVSATRLMGLPAHAAGISAGVGAELASQLAHRYGEGSSHNLWLRWQGRWHTGTCDFPAGETGCRVRLVGTVSVDGAGGFVCEDVRTLELCWLPLEEASHARGASPAAVAKALGRRPLNVARMGRGRVSFLAGNPALAYAFEAMPVGDPADRHMVTILEVLDSASGHAYSCQEEPNGNVYALESELEHAAGERLEVFCVRKDDDGAVMYPTSERRVSVRLSRTLLRVLDGSTKAKRIKRELVGAAYRDAAESDPRRIGTELRAPGESGDSLAHPSLLIASRLATARRLKDDDSEPDISLLAGLHEAFNEPAATDESPEVSIVTAVMLAELLLRLGKRDAADQLLRVLSSGAETYAREDVLLRRWLVDGPRYGSLDLRSLLERVDFRGLSLVNNKRMPQKIGMLSLEKFEDLVQTCGTVLRRKLGEEAEGPQAAIALCLLASVDELPIAYEADYRETLHDSPCLRLESARCDVEYLRRLVGELVACEVRVMTDAGALLEALPE